MDESRVQRARRLRAVGDGRVSDPALIEATVAAVVAEAPGGLAPRGLAAAVAERLGVAVAAVPARGLQAALGVLIATGRVDEAGGRLVAVGQEERRAG
jgi:hypothetical protein